MITFKRIFRTVGPIYRWLLDLFIPPQCVVCGQVDVWLCDACAQQLPIFQAACCPRCGRPTQRAELCRICYANPLKVAPIRSAFLFQGEVRQAIHALKYRGGHTVVAPLTKRMAEAWHKDNMKSDLLIPVPLHSDREARRGYNQAALLAQALGQHITIPVRLDALTRVRPTRSQTQLNRQARQDNVKDAFACTDNLNLKGKHVTLIDDVATTGATLNACAVALLNHGVGQVSAFTLARAS